MAALPGWAARALPPDGRAAARMNPQARPGTLRLRRGPGMANLPNGTVTFLLTDIGGSTALWEREPAAMQEALARHDALLAAGIGQHGGATVKSRGEGD